MGTITVNNLGKAYKKYFTRWSRLLEWLDPRGKIHHQLLWVLEDVSFEIEAGQTVGIIGINGAGKSTLLKMLAGTTQPTVGNICVTGQIAALLELGMGFHPDFTGRQNAYMAGQLLGHTMEKLHQLMPEIEAFAEIGEYIDQPIRTYSSGMQMRLAFSVATAHRPDILIVDEALSVGDTYFQHKSFERIRQFTQAGTTLLIVSHDINAIQSICNRAILLNDKRIIIDGQANVVADYYNAMLAKKQDQLISQENTKDGAVKTISGTKEASLDSIKIYQHKNHVEQSHTIYTGRKTTIEASIKVHKKIEKLVFGFSIKNRLGQVIFGSTSEDLGESIEKLSPGNKIKIAIDFDANLGAGSYSISTALAHGKQHTEGNIEWHDLALVFDVTNHDKPHFVGSCWIESKISILVKD